MKIDWTTFNLPEFFAAFILSITLWLLDKQRKPNIALSVSESSNLKPAQSKFKILNIKVSNHRRTGIGKFFNQTATQVRAVLVFKDYDSQKELLKIIARWNTSREPLTPDYKQVDVGLALTSPREVISPGEEATISVAIKKEGNKSCYPFNNESYLNSDFSKPEWEMEDDKIIVTVQIKSAETEMKDANFIVINKKSLQQFTLARM